MAIPVDRNETDFGKPSRRLNALSLFVDSYRAPPDALAQIDDKHLTVEQRKQFRQLIEEYADVFAGDKNALGLTDEVTHRITLHDDTPIKQSHYRVAHNKRKFLDEEVKRMYQQGIVVDSKSDWASPVVLVPKPNGEWHFCVDFRQLNKKTVKDAFPIPIVDDLLDKMNGATYYSGLDLQSGFWQIRMDPKDQKKTAFCTPDGLFEFTVMPFGLTNAPATFQRLMTHVLKGLNGKNVVVFIDDLCVFSRSWEEHLVHLRAVFDRLRKAGLRLNIAKSHFARPEQKFLGFIVSKDGVKTDPQKVKAMKEFPTPRNLTQLRSFLGTTNFYRRFIQNYSALVLPLIRLTRKDVPYEWGEAQNTAFETLKDHMTKAPYPCLS